jgi:putative membrane protein insertion efficiency factor
MTPAAALAAGVIVAYRTLVSPLLPGTCRFQPTCSAYALEALRRHGAGRGGLLAIRRLLRCHPWGGWGPDPVPDDDDGGRQRCPSAPRGGRARA